MTIIFEGTFAELQKRVSTLPLPSAEFVRLVTDDKASADLQSLSISMEEPSNADAKALYFDSIKEMAEDDDDYFLRFYRSSGH